MTFYLGKIDKIFCIILAGKVSTIQCSFYWPTNDTSILVSINQLALLEMFSSQFIEVLVQSVIYLFMVGGITLSSLTWDQIGYWTEMMQYHLAKQSMVKKEPPCFIGLALDAMTVEETLYSLWVLLLLGYTQSSKISGWTLHVFDSIIFQGATLFLKDLERWITYSILKICHNHFYGHLSNINIFIPWSQTKRKWQPLWFLCGAEMELIKKRKYTE